jgi:hypothetical protein
VDKPYDLKSLEPRDTGTVDMTLAMAAADAAEVA